MSTLKEEALVACRICLAVDTEFYNIRDCKLENSFTIFLGSKLSMDGYPQHVCGWCRAQLARWAALRARCERSQALLHRALAPGGPGGPGGAVTMDYLRNIDRVAEKLNTNLKINSVHNSDSTQPQEIVKLENIKQESNDFIENIFVDEPTVLNDFDDCNANDGVSNGCFKYDGADSVKCENLVGRNLKRTRAVSTKTRKRKVRKTEPSNELDSSDCTLTNKTKNKDKKASTKQNDGERAKRIIKRRMADNGFLPDFNFEEFESKYEVKIDILSKDEQLREIEAKKMASSYTMSAFGCEICGKAFATKQVYDEHMLKHSVSAGAHACEVCRVRFPTRSRAHVHQDAHRLRFTCARCGFLTRTRFIAKNHFLSHAGTTHKCPHCDAVFNKYTSYLTHVRRRHPAMNAACDECGETFVGATGLRHHKTRAHRAAVKFQYKCTCGAHFATSQALERHKSAASEGGCDTSLRPCATCGEGFSSEDSLRSHEAVHTARSHPCRECNKSFVDARSFDTHVARVHLNIRLKEPPRARRGPAARLVCERCGSECTSLTNLAAHQRSHSGDKPHACPACALRFASLHNMRRHHRVVHLGQRPQVKCTICGKLLAHASSLKLHVNTVHLKMPLPPRQRRRRDGK